MGYMTPKDQSNGCFVGHGVKKQDYKDYVDTDTFEISGSGDFPVEERAKFCLGTRGHPYFGDGC